MNETIPMFNQGDLVKDKFGNIFKIITMLAAQHFEQDSFEYDEMGYLLKLIDKAPNTRDREVGDGAEFHREGDEYWIYNTKADIRAEDYEVTPETIFATELVLFEKSEDSEESVEADMIEESDVPIFLAGDLVRDAFGNTFEVYEAKPSQRLDPDRFDYCNMGYRLKLVTKNPQSPIREVHDNIKFVQEGSIFWIYNREEDARAVNENNPYTITASELVLVRSILQTRSTKPAKAELTRRYPSIEDLQKMSEENDLGNLLDQAYSILKEQASLGERNANLQFEKFKRCIPYFEHEGFEVLEHGVRINVRW